MSSNLVISTDPTRRQHVSFCLGTHPLSDPSHPNHLGFTRLLRNENLSLSDTELAMKRREEEQKLLDEGDDSIEMSSFQTTGMRSILRSDHVEENEEDGFNEVEVDVVDEAKKRRRHRRRRSGSFSGGMYPRKHRHLVGFRIPPPNVHTQDWSDMLAVTNYREPFTGHHSDTEIGKSTEGGTLHPRDLSYRTQPAPPLFHQMKFSSSDLSLNRACWIAETFCRRECSRFVPTKSDHERCGCGRNRAAHIDIPTLTGSLLMAQGSSLVEKKRRETDDEKSDGLKMMAPRRSKGSVTERWSLRKHTILLPTNAFGQIEFQGGPHPYKAQYVRLSFDTDCAHIMSLFDHVWQIAPPKLIITVHGGTGNFDLQTKLARVFRKGLFKAAQTTGAWILTSGMDSGVVKHVAAAWESAGASPRSKVVCIGIAPWGLLKKRDELIGQDKVVPYYPYASKSRFMPLNNRHSYFLLVDNGTVGRFGAEVILRKRLETYIAQKQKISNGTTGVPVVCVVVEGGTCTIRSVLDYVTNVPRVPVVVCDGSGRAADLLAFAHQTMNTDGTFPEGVQNQLSALMQKVFAGDKYATERLVAQLSICAQDKTLMTIFRLGEKEGQSMDHAILTALLTGSKLSPPDQLSLALAWNRVDIARFDIFTKQWEWSQAALYDAMHEALIHNRVDFVKLLLENGVSMQKFLTIGRLEELYNTDKGPPNTLYYIVRDVVRIRAGYTYKLPHIGLAIEKLLGNAYKSTYTSQEFRQHYDIHHKKVKHRAKLVKSVLASAASRSRGGSVVLSRQSTDPVLLGNFTASMTDTHALSENMVAPQTGSRALGNHILWRSAYRRDNPINPLMKPPKLGESNDIEEEINERENNRSISSNEVQEGPEFEFRYPFSELLIWAVLTKRQEMAMCMWQHGEEAMAKALIACKLYKSLATEAAEDYLEVEICEELKKYAEEFRLLSMELLEHCYRLDDAQTLQLLTYELSNWGRQTCISLAVIVNNKEFLAHPCCQILLADLWHGGLRIRNHSNLRVITGLICPLYLFALEFKSKDELLNQPQRAAEHEQDIAETSSDSDAPSSDSSDSEEDDDERNDTDREMHNKRSRRASHGSTQSINQIQSLFKSGRKRKNRLETRDTDMSCNEARAENGEANTYGTFVGQSGTISPHSFVRRKQKTIWKDQVRSDVSTKDSIAGSKGTLEDRSTPISVTKESGKIEKSRRFNVGATTLPRMRQIKWRRKFYEFYAAPITAFWAWAISFVVFMCFFTYVLLVRTPRDVYWPEWVIFLYIFSFTCEYVRRFIMSEMEPLSLKVRYFFSSFWTLVTTAAIVVYYIGFALRLSRDPEIRAYGRVILACDCVIWTMKFLDFMSVHPKLGPYITMAGKMIQNMVYIVIMLMVALLGFGLARQSITYPNEDWHWILLRNIFYKPYFMLYGEVYADEIDTCGDEAWDSHFEDGTPLSLFTNGTIRQTCVPGHWIPPILTTFFLLIANILLMSMLIAIFNHIFESTTEIAQQIWLFQRYNQVMEYEGTPFCPPPFTPLRHLIMAGEYIKWRCDRKVTEKDSQNNKRHVFDYSLKLFLNQDQVEKLHDFEEDCMEDMYREKEKAKHTSNEERIYRASERTETILNRVSELQVRQKGTGNALVELDQRLQAIEKNQDEILEFIRMIAARELERPTTPPPDVHLEVIVDPPEAADEENRGEDLPPLPVRKRQRTNTVCGTDRHTRDSTDEGPTSPRPGSFRTRFSSLASLDASIKLKRTSKRRPRQSVYTSITDSIEYDPDVRRSARNLAMDRGSPNDSDLALSGDEQFRKKMSIDRKITLAQDKKKSPDDEEADCELTEALSDIEDMEIGLGEERRSTVGSKDGGMFQVVDEEESRVPQPSPQHTPQRSPTPPAFPSRSV